MLLIISGTIIGPTRSQPLVTSVAISSATARMPPPPVAMIAPASHAFASVEHNLVAGQPNAVLHGCPRLPPAGLGGHVVEIALGLRVLVVDCRWNPARLQRLDPGQTLDGARRAEHVASHALGGRHQQTPRVVAKDVF